jgi:hypothetical protein
MGNGEVCFGEYITPNAFSRGKESKYVNGSFIAISAGNSLSEVSSCINSQQNVSNFNRSIDSVNYFVNTENAWEIMLKDSSLVAVSPKIDFRKLSTPLSSESTTSF